MQLKLALHNALVTTMKQDNLIYNIFENAYWIWSQEEDTCESKLFRKQVDVSNNCDKNLEITITASYHYELFINGNFVNSGPVYGDPLWCQYDNVEYRIPPKCKYLEIVIVVHNRNSKILSILPAPGGLLAEFRIGDEVIGTDNSWQYRDLPMWENNVPKRGWALGPCESYNAILEPEGWQEKTFSKNVVEDWPHAKIVVNAHSIWANYTPRITPMLRRADKLPKSFKVFKAQRVVANHKIDLLSDVHDSEFLEKVTDFLDFSSDSVNHYVEHANCFTFDLGKELVGYFSFEIETDSNLIIEISGAERLRDGRPWISPREEQYTVRYVSREGKQRFTSLSWTGFRYLHFVIRGYPEKFKFKYIGCTSKGSDIQPIHQNDFNDNNIKKIFDICMHTLRISAQEHLIDCPTREQLQYWGDAVFIAQSLWHAFAEESYLKWYMECFIHCPFRNDGLISSVYPGDHDGWALLDYNLIPVIAQQFYKKNKGLFYNPQQFFAKAMLLNKWFDKHKNSEGLMDFDTDEYLNKKIRIFIDHPGIGWHDFPHPGIERKGTNCPLNMFYYNFVKVLAGMAREIEDKTYVRLKNEAEELKNTIVRKFYNGVVFHDSINGNILSKGTSWQTNSLAVCFDILTGTKAKKAIEYLLDNYDRLCRCSPYFYFYLLAAMEKTGMQQQAIELIKREWAPMIKNGNTTTWETFSGNERDSLCHPWSTAPALFLLKKIVF